MLLLMNDAYEFEVLDHENRSNDLDKIENYKKANSVDHKVLDLFF